MERIVVIGWGRMGATHTSIINGLYPERYRFEIVEQNFWVRNLLKNSLGYTVHRDINDIDLRKARVIVTTPPTSHQELTNYCVQAGAHSIFVEKPFSVSEKRITSAGNISVGYVLRFSEITKTLKELLNTEGCKKISLKYSSHTLKKKPKGWRNSVHGGVLNEMGSHLIDFLMYVSGEVLSVNNVDSKSVVSDVEDIVRIKGKLGEIETTLSLNWVNPDYRKPIWSGKILMEDGREFVFDQQSISGGFIPDSVDYYVRGRDFSLQMSNFIRDDKSIICDANDANRVHDVIDEIKKRA